jgi:hypothetical protein
MSLPLTLPPMIFPAISLLYLSYNARFQAVAQLIRSLHGEWKARAEPRVLAQIRTLRVRLRLIVAMQAVGALSFAAAAVSTTCLFFGAPLAGHVAFGASLLFLIASVLILLREIQVSTVTLGILLAETEATRVQVAA